MPAERYGFEVSAWVEPKDYDALRADVNRAIDRAIAAERERCAAIADNFRSTLAEPFSRGQHSAAFNIGLAIRQGANAAKAT